jgi:hypothetical protein
MTINNPAGETRAERGETGNVHDGHTLLNIEGRAPTTEADEADQYASQALSGANWFFWIAGLSLVNAVIVLAGGSWGFLAGLGATQFISALGFALRESLGAGALILAFALDVLAASIFVVFGLLARNRQTWAYIIGMVVYVIDGLILLLVQDWLSMAFHAFALYCIFKGLAANNRLKELQAETAIAKGQAA